MNIPTCFFGFKVRPNGFRECVGLFYPTQPRDRKLMNQHSKNKDWSFEPYFSPDQNKDQEYFDSWVW